MDDIKLYTKLATLPENLKSEVSDFIDFLLSKVVKEKENIPGPKPIFGSAKGMFKMNDDFVEPSKDFKDYMS
jgi:hypothetical protein